MTRKVLVTGATGRLGSLLITRLQEDGWSVRAFTHSRPVEGADEEYRGTLVDPAACKEALEGCEAVVHSAGATHARRKRIYWEANVDTTRSLVTAAVEGVVPRFLLLSSRTAGPAGGWYGASKLAAEQIVTGSPLPWTIVRLAEVYGAGSGEGIDQVIASAKSGGRVLVPGRGESQVCPVHADDAVRACTVALRSQAAVGSIYVVGGDCLPLQTFAERCIEVAGSPARVVFVPWTLTRAAAVAGRLVGPVYPDQVARLKSTKPAPTPAARADLAFEARPLEDGLRSVMRF